MSDPISENVGPEVPINVGQSQTVMDFGPRIDRLEAFVFPGGVASSGPVTITPATALIPVGSNRDFEAATTDGGTLSFATDRTDILLVHQTSPTTCRVTALLAHGGAHVQVVSNKAGDQASAFVTTIAPPA